MEINGNISGASKQTVYLEQINVGNTIVIDSLKTNKKGEFTFKSKVENPMFYTVKINNENIPLLVKAGEKISIKGNVKKISNYSVEGSEGSELIKELNVEKRLNFLALDSLQKLYAALPEDKKFDTERKRISDEWDTVFMRQVRYSRNFIITYATSPVAYYALYQQLPDGSFILDPINENYSYRVVATSMKAIYPESQYTKALLAHFDRIQQEMRNLKMKRFINESGSDLPELQLPNAKGDTVSLASLKNKLIVLDFSALGEEGAEEHYKSLQNTYNKFRSRGVEIYQVCFDKNRLLWQELVSGYGIKWVCVWDETGSSLRTWNVQNLPSNYILNSKHEIVGKNLFGASLNDRLNDLLK